MTKNIFKTEFGGKELTVEFGQLAHQANASCTVTYGETVVFASATMSSHVREGLSWFPLMVDYEEKLYAAGKIKGSRFIKREGRPTDEAVLTGRMIDRGLRPLFDSSIRNDIQVITSVLSFDGENDPDVIAITAASIALHISDIPWNGPLVGIRVGYVDGQYILNPDYEQMEKSSLDLGFSAVKDKVIMVESGANEVSEEVAYGGFEFGLKHAQPLIEFIEGIRKEIGKEKVVIEKKAPHIDGDDFTPEMQTVYKDALEKFLEDKWDTYVFNIPRGSKGERKKTYGEVKKLAKEFLLDNVADATEGRVDYVLSDFDARVERKVSDEIIENKRRVDGRSITDIRDLSAKVGVLPRPHGSAIFSRGETQILSVVTLGAPGDEQILDGMEEIGRKHYMHHYNFPPYSVGDVSPLRGASRREIGHGALAEKALIPVLPPKDEFPYTIRVVSEVMGSNGSSSMGSACGSSLALMDAGVPIKRPVAGIAIGLASDANGNEQVITDIQDMEDGDGGMDFKVCGTTEGITAIQMDTKTLGLSLEVIKEALEQGKEARFKILDVMTAEIAEPRAELSKYAPRIITFTINPDKIRDVIGPGGKMINEIIAETDVAIDIEDDGMVFVTSPDAEMAEKAKQMILDIVEDLEVGKIYRAKVIKTLNFGAVVEVKPRQEGLVHISEMAEGRVNKVEDVVKLGDVITVKLVSIDASSGKMDFSIIQADPNYKPKPKAPRGPRPPRGPRAPREGNFKKRSDDNGKKLDKKNEKKGS